MRFELVEVERFPAEFEPGCLYWSREFRISAHRCACGCGDVINLPIDVLNYRISEGREGLTLRPSVGNWGVCDAHYLITNGEVVWARKWTNDEISLARAAEDARRDAQVAPASIARSPRWIDLILAWLRSRFSRE